MNNLQLAFNTATTILIQLSSPHYGVVVPAGSGTSQESGTYIGQSGCDTSMDYDTYISQSDFGGASIGADSYGGQDDALELETAVGIPVVFDESTFLPIIASDNAQFIFDQLAQKWEDETGFLSVTTQRFSHQSYQDILAMGDCAVPLILHRMKTKPGNWFAALRLLTNNGVAPDRRLTHAQLTDLWLNYGRENYSV